MFSHNKRTWMILGAVALSLTLLMTGTALIGAQGLGPRAMSQATGATGQGHAATTALVSGNQVQVTYSDTVPQLTPDQERAQQLVFSRSGRTGPKGATNTSAAGQTTGPGTSSPNAMANAPTGAPGDLITFRNSVIPGTAIAGGYGYASYTQEPSTAVNGKNIFQTGNWYASRSLDNGATWSYLNPFTIFSDSTVKGYCCDQVTIYDPGRDRVFWELQYGNGLKLALSSGTSLFTSWCYYNITPGTVGEPSDTEIDYNDVAIGTEYIYIASNLFPSSGGSESVILRLPIDSLLTCGGWNGAFVKVSDRFTFKPAQGSTDVMYWGTNWGGNNGSDFRIYSWAENSGSYFWYDRGIDGYTFMYRNGGQNCASGDGVVTNWCQFADSRVLGGYRANGVVGFSFNAQQDQVFPWPYTRRVYFRESDMAYLGSTNFWGDWAAHLFMQLTPNARGHIGGSFAFGGGNGTAHVYPGAGYLLEDDYSPNQPWAYNFYLWGSGNTCQYNDNGTLLWRWGDYLTIRPYDPARDLFAATGYAMVGGIGGPCGTGKAKPHNVIFGRFRDAKSYSRWNTK